MSFAAIEESRYQGEPVSLFHFQYGEGPDHYFGYTDAEQGIVHMGKVYQPIPIDMGTVRSSGSLDKQSIEVHTPQNVELAEMFKLVPPSTVITLVVRQGHLSDPSQQFLVTWTGRVLSHKRQENEAIYTVESVATSMRRAILRRHYMLACPHVLYGPQCKANKAAASQTKMVLSLSGPLVTLADDWAATGMKDKYVGGLVEWTTAEGVAERRSILKIKGVARNQLLLESHPRGLEPGASLTLVLGCNHLAGLEDDCIVLHDNIHNYGGFPWIPIKNPIGITNNYY